MLYLHPKTVRRRCYLWGVSLSYEETDRLYFFASCMPPGPVPAQGVKYFVIPFRLFSTRVAPVRFLVFLPVPTFGRAVLSSREWSYHAVEHLVHCRIDTPGRDAGEVDMGGVDRSMAQALPDQFHGVAGFQHQRRPGMPEHVGGERRAQSGQPAYLRGVPVHAPEGALFRQVLRLFPFLCRAAVLPFPARLFLLVVEEGEHVRGVFAEIPVDDGFRLGRDFHLDGYARLAAAVADMPVPANHVMPQVPDVLEHHAAHEEDEVQHVQRLAAAFVQLLPQLRGEQPGQQSGGQGAFGGGLRTEAGTGKGVAPLCPGKAVRLPVAAAHGTQVAQVEFRRAGSFGVLPCQPLHVFPHPLGGQLPEGQVPESGTQVGSQLVHAAAVIGGGTEMSVPFLLFDTLVQHVHERCCPLLLSLSVHNDPGFYF